MPNNVSPQESLARYVFQRSYFRANGTVKFNAFMPARDGNTSVFRVSGLTDSEVWRIGRQYVAIQRPLLGRAQVVAQRVLDIGLGVESAVPPPRHANIMGWPGDHSERKMLAQQLAAKAELYPLPDSS